MYENETMQSILQRMLGNVPSDVDKREGSIIFDALAPAALEWELAYAALDFFLKNTFGDTADRAYLIERALERSLKPYPATFAEARGEFLPDSLEIAVGSRFSYDDLNFVVTGKEDPGLYRLKCETAGVVGNVPEGRLIPIDYIQGLESARLIEILVPGEDEEDTEAFRKRYLASFDSQAFGGNILDYKNKVNALQGVGGVKVYPIWDGGGTVRIVFMTSEYGVPTTEHIQAVQTAIDPVTNHGEGVGIAPVGHTVTVEGVENSSVAVSLKVTVEGDLDSYKDRILAEIDDYFLMLNKSWESTKTDDCSRIANRGILVRISQIDNRILDIEGVVDVEHTELNGVNENLMLDADSLAVRGEVEWR